MRQPAILTASEPFPEAIGCWFAMTACFGAHQFNRPGPPAPYDLAGEVSLDLLLETLDLIDLAIMLIDRVGRVFYANRAARDVLGEGDVVRLCHGRLATVSAKTSSSLHAALAGIARSGETRPRHGVVVPLTDMEGTVRAASWVLPLTGRRSVAYDAAGAGCAAVVIRQIAPASHVSSEFFTRCYGVTHAEKRLLETLAEGMTVAEAGQALKVSLNTVKSHLKSLFAKTGTNRQAELMRLVLNTMPPAST
jgi:DNA-binding CsgD family transcriptional regulator